MTALVRSELLKLWTTRSRWGYLIAVALLAGIAAASDTGTSGSDRRGSVELSLSLVDSAAVAALLALVLGITVVTTEFRHGTITPAFLAEPRRERVLVAKALATGLAALALAVFALAVIALVAGIWLAVDGAGVPPLDGEVLRRATLLLLLAVLWGLLGVAIGTLVQNQVAALVGTLIWVFLGETLLWGLFTLLHVEGARAYLPFQALDSADGSHGGDQLSTAAGIAVSLAWIAGLGVLGVARTRRRDIN